MRRKVLFASMGMSFYRKSERAFVGKEINYTHLTDDQLNKTIEEAINLYNKLFPPSSGLFRKLVSIVAIVVTAGVAAAFVLASYGIGLGSALGAISSTVTTVAGPTSIIGKVQKVASVVSKVGAVKAKVTGDSPSSLVKAANFIKSPTALKALEKAAITNLQNEGVAVQQKDQASILALREKLKREQYLVSARLLKMANDKSIEMGQPTPVAKENKELPILQIMAVATPFILGSLS